jgi:Pyruvate/2-oxoacid:ferredoxin oxidoreductase gamma subunit
MSHLRFREDPIGSPYDVEQANCIECHSSAYLKKFDMTSQLRKVSVPA